MSTKTMDSPLPQVPEPPRRPQTLTYLLASFGALILLGVVLGTSWSALNTLSRGDSFLSANAQGITSVEVDADAREFNFEFADVPEAQLDIRSSDNGWELSRQGTALIVDSPDGWANWCIFGCDSTQSTVVLTLPEALNDGSLDVDLELSAGEFYGTGQFNSLVLEMSAGRLVASGSANSVDVRLGAGHASLELADVREASFEVSAGRLDGVLTGSVPASVSGEVSAGMLDLALPTASYDVRSTVSAGNLDNRLTTDPAAANKVLLDVSAGNVVLRESS
ncbi:hypothetical protein [Glutamicibacter uratoxydans]|uniref:hypothetical protein n=1 Tax=Glutamicibacter uratoxydans TaxID=43667 RepID=UPI003D6F7BD3